MWPVCWFFWMKIYIYIYIYIYIKNARSTKSRDYILVDLAYIWWWGQGIACAFTRMTKINIYIYIYIYITCYVYIIFFIYAHIFTHTKKVFKKEFHSFCICCEKNKKNIEGFLYKKLLIWKRCSHYKGPLYNSPNSIKLRSCGDVNYFQIFTEIIW